jgi:hypothetical protein
VTYREITPRSRLVYAQSFSDKDRNITRHPMAPNWPQEMVTMFEFINTCMLRRLDNQALHGLAVEW